MAAFDIAPFSLPNCPAGELRFEEPRDIERVVVTFARPAPAQVALEYLRKSWPATRFERTGDMDLKRPSQFGWIGIDDWFNTRWTPAAANVRHVSARVLVFTFQGLNAETRDCPDAAAYDVTFRRTVGIRIVSPGAAVRKVQIFTRSAAARTALRVELDAGCQTAGRQVTLEGYNAVVRRITAPGAAVTGNTLAFGSASSRSFGVTLDHMAPAHRFCNDAGLVTFHLDDETSTISLASLEAQGPIWFAEQGIYVARADDAWSFADYQAAIKGTQTIARQVAARPEQSLGGARHGQPRPHPVPFCFGCKHARQKFWLEPNGDLELNKWLVTSQPGKDTPQWKNDGNARFFFGLERCAFEARFNDPWPLVAYNIHARRGLLRLGQKCFAVPLQESILAGEPPSDATIVALIRFEFENTGDAPLPAELLVGYADNAPRTMNRRLELARGQRTQTDYLIPVCPRTPLRSENGRILSNYGGQPVLRAVYATTMEPAQAENSLSFNQMLAPGQKCQVVLKIPFVAVAAPEELAALDALDFDRACEEMKQYWLGEGRRGASIHTPEAHLDAAYAGHLPIVLFTDLGFPDGSGLVNTSVGTATYGNFTNESCMILEELDQRGLADEVRRRLGVWVKYQGTARLNGNFTDCNGVLFGAAGLEMTPNYNQNHGWALWRLGQHYLMTRDAQWFASVADAVVAAADWIFRQRRGTLTELPHSRGWEKGFLPAGALEDVDDFFYWLSTNVLTWRGADTAAAALEAAKHPAAARIRTEADAYRKDLVTGLEISRQYAPLVRLRDGRWIPRYPSRLYCRGRDAGWIREVLEGSIYLLLSGLYAPQSRQAQWILDDYLDTRYMDPPFGYPIQDWELEWFDQGGFSVQPLLLAGLLPHLDRDEIELYLWMFFNAWAACYREEINAMVEHPLPVLGFSNSAPFKTSDQSNAMKWLVYMFVYERDDLLHLGRAVPRDWLAGGNRIWARDVATHFGKVSIEYQPSADAALILARADLALARAPGQILIRFRHPEKRAIRSVLVNGKPCAAFHPDTGDVEVTGLRGELCVEVRYGCQSRLKARWRGEAARREATQRQTGGTRPVPGSAPPSG